MVVWFLFIWSSRFSLMSPSQLYKLNSCEIIFKLYKYYLRNGIAKFYFFRFSPSSVLLSILKFTQFSFCQFCKIKQTIYNFPKTRRIKTNLISSWPIILILVICQEEISSHLTEITGLVKPKLRIYRQSPVISPDIKTLK